MGHSTYAAKVCERLSIPVEAGLVSTEYDPVGDSDQEGFHIIYWLLQEIIAFPPI